MAIPPSTAFVYRLRVQPHHTDYAGIVWHGTYVAWLEEVRVEYLRTLGLGFDQWVAGGVDLPVVDLSLRYRRALGLGMEAVIYAWPAPRSGLRLTWLYQVCNGDTGELCVEAQVDLAPVDRDSRRPLRRLPSPFQETLDRLYGSGQDRAGSGQSHAGSEGAVPLP